MFAAACAAQDEYYEDSPCDSLFNRVRDRQLSIVDSLYTSVLTYFPLEIMDTAAWRDSCDAMKEFIERSTYHAQVDVGGELSGLIQDITNQPNLGTSYKLMPCEEPESVVGIPDYAWSTAGGVRRGAKETQFPVLIWDGHFLGKRYYDALNDCLDGTRNAEGMLLVLDWASQMTITEALECAGRFVTQPTEFLPMRIRIPGTNDYRDTVFTVQPTGEWQYTGPVAIQMENSNAWPDWIFVAALKASRRYVTFLGRDISYPKGFRPIAVQISDNCSVTIPTAYPVTSRGKPLNRMRPDLELKERKDYSDAEFAERQKVVSGALNDLVRRYKRERVDRMEQMFQK